MTIERKYERDVDVLLAEEFAVNAIFSQEFKALTKFSDIGATVEDVWVSKSTVSGESDLIVLYQIEGGERFALLIEDKVDAPLQPEQAARYHLRAQKDRSSGIYIDYEVILCAPRHYIERRADLDGFDHLVSLEQIAEIIRRSGDQRSKYRASFLEDAGTRRINTWSREIDTATNAVWDFAFEIGNRDFPEIEMKRLSVTKDSTWVEFRPRDFPTQPKRVYLSLKGDRGQIDLTFGNTSAYLFQTFIAGLLESDMTVHPAGASAAIRIETQGFVISDGVVAIEPKIRAAFRASSRLIALYRRWRPEFDDAAKKATPGF